MPELPEVETIVRSLAPALTGRRIAGVWGSGLALRLGRPVDLKLIAALSVERRIEAVRRRGKYILLDLGAGAGLSVHLGMSGRLRLQRADEARLPHTHLVWTLAGGDELRFIDPRRFGSVTAALTLASLPELATLGPDPLSELDAAGLAVRLRGGRAPIKAFLLDQRRVAGLGNIYVCEALHRARIHPAVRAARVQRRADALLEGIRGALGSGIANRGTTLRDYVDADGVRGENAAALLVYGREGQPCFRCGAPIRRRIDAARSTFFCAACQKR
jgi:formamidopyrimidine-DNA glycosylase